MNKLPGLPTISALMLTAVLATWLCIAGPPNLKDWQTLIAAALALGGGALAYKSAMMKIGMERDEAVRASNRRRLALLLKVDMAASVLHDQARNADAMLTFSNLDGVESYNVASIMLTEPEAFREAWDYLDVFPKLAIKEIYLVRQAFAELAPTFEFINRIQKDGKIQISDAAHSLYKVENAAETIWQSCSVIRHELDPDIRRLAPAMDEADRNIAIYGEPDSFEEED